MNIKLYFKVLSIVLSLAVITESFAISVIDDENNTVTLSRPAQRVITLAPSLTEMVFKIGAEDKLVATVKSSDFPAAAKNIARIGDYERFSLETLLSYKPDLVIAWRVDANHQQIKKIKSFNIPTYLISPHGFEDISNTVRNIGTLLGKQRQAKAVADGFERRLARLRFENKHKTRLRAFYQIWYEPIYTVNGKTVISQIMKLCGLDNIFAQSRISAPKITEESVIDRNPEIIIASGIVEGISIKKPEWLNIWGKWPVITAVANDNLFFINPDIINRQSTRILDGTAKMCEFADEARKNLSKNKQVKKRD